MYQVSISAEACYQVYNGWVPASPSITASIRFGSRWKKPLASFFASAQRKHLELEYLNHWTHES